MRLAFAGAVALALTATASVADTFRITIASGHPPVIPWTGALDDLFIAEVDRLLTEAGGEHTIDWTRAYSGSVAPIGGVLEAIEDGIVDMGIVGAVFEPTNLPLNNVMIFAPFNGTDVRQNVAIMDEMVAATPEMQAAFAEFNQVYLTAVGVDNFDLFTKEPVASLNDLAGMTVGAAGPNLNWLRGADITGVQVDLTTIYNDMATGIYEGVLLFPSSAAAIRLQEVAPYHLAVGFGANAWGALSINADVWADMPEEVQDAFRAAALHYRDSLGARLREQGEAGLARMIEVGLTSTALPIEARTEWALSLPNIAAEWAEPLASDGLPAQSLLDAYVDGLRARDMPIVRDWAAETASE